MQKTWDGTLDEIYALSKKVEEQEKLRYQPRNKKEEQEFEWRKMDKQFQYDYMVKWGVPPGSVSLKQLQDKGNTKN